MFGKPSPGSTDSTRGCFADLFCGAGGILPTISPLVGEMSRKRQRGVTLSTRFSANVVASRGENTEGGPGKMPRPPCRSALSPAPF